MQTQGVAATGHSYIVYNREIQSWLTGSFCDFHQVSRYVSYRDSSIAIRIVSWGYRIVTPLNWRYTNVIGTYPNVSNCNQFLDLYQAWLWHLKAQWKGTFFIAVTELSDIPETHHMCTLKLFHIIYLQYLTKQLVSQHTLSRHYASSTLLHAIPAINHTFILVRKFCIIRLEDGTHLFSFTQYIWNKLHKYISFPWRE